MSQYRSDRDADRLRIEALEAQLAERDAALSEQRVTIAEHDAEIARLRHQLVLAGVLPPRARPAQAAWATRLVGLSVVVAAAALGASFLAIRAQRPMVVEVVTPPMEQVAPKVEPILADPAPIAVRHEPAEEEAAPIASSVPQEDAVRRQLEPRVWAGQATVEEIRLLKAICARQADHACRRRAAAMLPGAKPPVF